LGAVSFVGTPAHAVSAPDPYSGHVDTACSVNVPATIEPGKHAVIKVTVSANSPKTPKGHLDVTISKAGGSAVWSKTVSYNGGTKTLVGPVLPKADYVAKAKFRPSGNTFAGSRCSKVSNVDDVDDNNPDGPDGLLPDTGGPAMLWLLVGIGLVGGGAGSVAYSRRRNAPATV
jgi:LPXTG-motif cell wall-anchored protein